jgi:hypothetical protein
VVEEIGSGTFRSVAAGWLQSPFVKHYATTYVVVYDSAVTLDISIRHSWHEPCSCLTQRGEIMSTAIW